MLRVVVSTRSDASLAGVACGERGGTSHVSCVPHPHVASLPRPALWPAQDKICTFVGSILVVVNPFRRIDGFLGVENMEKCKGKKLWNAACGPHTYSIAEQVCDQRSMRQLMRQL